MKKAVARTCTGALLKTMVLIASLLLGAVSVNAATAKQAGPAPTVSEIVIDSYDCDTGDLNFHVTVTDLPSVPDGTSGFDYPLGYQAYAYYEGGTETIPPRLNPWSPPADQAPYTGVVNLSINVPSTNLTAQGQTVDLESIELYVAVGYGGTGYGAFDNPTDTASTTYAPDCSPEPPGTELEQLIALIISIILAILAQL